MIYLDKNNAVPLYMQIYSQIRDNILDGRLEEGYILPGGRGLSMTLGVSRNTVDNAYGLLAAEGYICPKKGVGYMVMKVPELTGGRKRGREALSHQSFPERRHPVQSDEGQLNIIQPGPGQPNPVRSFPDLSARIPPSPAVCAKQDVLYDLTNSSHTSDLFPKRLWKKYTLECLDMLEAQEKISAYQDKQGELYLRTKLLSYLERIRGVCCEESQIVVTCGIQQSLAYICKLLPQGKKTILMEEPGYHKAAAVFNAGSMTIKTVPVDENGMIVSGLPQNYQAWAVYTTPSHQFPTGVIMSIGRRYELLRWARQNSAYIIEDDFDSEQRYYAKPIPSLQSIDEDGRVIYLGTFSKALSPSLRMGYMILPPGLMKNYHEQFKDYNSTVPILNQYVVARLMETGQYDRHVRRLNLVFRKRLERFSEEFSDVKHRIRLSSNGTGQYFLLEFPPEADQENLIRKAMEQGVRVYPTMEFWQDKAACPANTLFLGFSKIGLEQIHDCVKRLKRAWEEWL